MKKLKEKRKINIKKVILIISLLICALFGVAFGFVTVIYNKYDLDIEQLTSINNGIKVYSANGVDTSLYNTNRSIVEINSIPQHVKNAFVATEDKRFYSHNGYDLKRIFKAGFVNLLSQSKSQGASTISQQLIKNAMLTNEKTYTRKIKEIILAIKIEKKFSKDEILEMYLNTIYFGSNAYGIENASRIYFNKSAQNLTLNEACCLAAIIKSPSYYSPINNYDNATERKNLVAKLMFDENYITEQEYISVKNSEIELSDKYEIDHSYEKEAIFEACKLLNLSERELINKNYQIITFKNDELQKAVINSNNEILNKSEKSTNSQLDSLSVVLNNDSQVLAYYSNSKYDLHNLRRQPASTLKPIAVYLPCFQHNILSPASLILDEEINYNGYSPLNADKKFHGQVSVRNAIANSLNIPAVKSLDYLGLKKAKNTLEDFNINISNSDLNLSLALGSVKNGVNMMDLVNAYSTLANMGTYKPYTFIKEILDGNGKVIYSYEKYQEEIAKKEDCFLLTTALKDTAEYGTAKRLSELNIPIASKTGTASNSSGNTDLYNISYTSEHTILTWMANIKDNKLSSDLHSSNQPTEIVKEICAYLYSNHKPSDFVVPTGIEKCAYDIVELETENKFIKPTFSTERYIAYDYFKTNNKPLENSTNKVDLKVELSKSGATISFNAKRNLKYEIVRKDNDGEKILETIKEKNGDIIFNDYNIFKYSEIEYFIKSNNETISNSQIIKPNDYLINQLNNEISSSKKKWYV